MFSTTDRLPHSGPHVRKKRGRSRGAVASLMSLTPALPNTPMRAFSAILVKRPSAQLLGAARLGSRPQLLMSRCRCLSDKVTKTGEASDSTEVAEPLKNERGEVCGRLACLCEYARVCVTLASHLPAGVCCCAARQELGNVRRSSGRQQEGGGGCFP